MLTRRIEISIRLQQLSLLVTDAGNTEHLLQSYPVSTAGLGVGELNGSYQTPCGRHLIAEKIGAGAPLYAIFRARQLTGKIWTPQWSASHPGQDWILSRILWLSGCEPGKNAGGEVDTQARYIYIHGTHAEHLIGTAVSHGCIRMKNTDMVALFDQVDTGTPVDIVDCQMPVGVNLQSLAD